MNIFVDVLLFASIFAGIVLARYHGYVVYRYQIALDRMEAVNAVLQMKLLEAGIRIDEQEIEKEAFTLAIVMRNQNERLDFPVSARVERPSSVQFSEETAQQPRNEDNQLDYGVHLPLWKTTDSGKAE